MTGLKLATFWRSGAAHRVRIALALKGLEFEPLAINLAKFAQKDPAFAALNPLQLVPALETDAGWLTQSLAIMEWLEETYPSPPLLPADPLARARQRAMAQVVACDIHPLNNQRALVWLRKEASLDDAAILRWCLAWVEPGFAALENMLAEAQGAGPWANGAAPGLADCCIAPQTFAAQSRYGLDITRYPRLAALDAAAQSHPAFIAAHPDTQPDAPRTA